MRCRAFVVLILSTSAIAQSATKPAPQPQSVTVPIRLDHNRIIIDVGIPLTNGTTERVHAWIDNGDPDLWMSKSVAALMGLTIICNGQICGATLPPEVAAIQIMIGGLKIALASTAGINVPGLALPVASSTIAPGISAGIKIPSTILRNYDVLINFPGREFTIAQPGSLKFNGVKAKVIVNAGNGLIQIASQIENKKYNLGLDLGSSIGFLSEDLFDKLSAAHSGWPNMTGAVGPANIWGSNDEAKQKLMRVERLQFGPLFLTNLAVAELSHDRMAPSGKPAGSGTLGSEALLNYRVGLDYAHSTVYFDIGRLFNSPDFDVIGLVLRPEDDGRFTILGVADYDGKPSVPSGAGGVQPGDHLVAVNGIATVGSTLGQVWSMLGGTPGQERKLTVERGGKQLNVIANVRHFLGPKE